VKKEKIAYKNNNSKLSKAFEKLYNTTKSKQKAVAKENTLNEQRKYIKTKVKEVKKTTLAI
jgi:hypothetical protein